MTRGSVSDVAISLNALNAINALSCQFVTLLHCYMGV